MICGPCLGPVRFEVHGCEQVDQVGPIVLVGSNDEAEGRGVCRAGEADGEAKDPACHPAKKLCSVRHPLPSDANDVPSLGTGGSSVSPELCNHPNDLEIEHMFCSDAEDHGGFDWEDPLEPPAP